jgi:hypothetical protein
VGPRIAALRLADIARADATLVLHAKLGVGIHIARRRIRSREASW